MISESQLNANRANAQKSTGPQSPETKRKVGMNAIKHGFAGQTVVIPAHDTEAYEEHFASFRREYRPVGPTEEFMVQSLADLTWSVQNMRMQATAILTMAGCKSHGITNTGATPEADAVLGQSISVDSMGPRLNLLSVYEARKMRLFHTTLKALEERQARRKAQHKADLIEAAIYRKACKLHQDPTQPEWHPNENGFVCSMEELDRHIHMQDLIHKPLKAAA